MHGDLMLNGVGDWWIKRNTHSIFAYVKYWIAIENLLVFFVCFKHYELYWIRLRADKLTFSSWSFLIFCKYRCTIDHLSTNFWFLLAPQRSKLFSRPNCKDRRTRMNYNLEYVWSFGCISFCCVCTVSLLQLKRKINSTHHTHKCTDWMKF